MEHWFIVVIKVGLNMVLQYKWFNLLQANRYGSSLLTATFPTPVVQSPNSATTCPMPAKHPRTLTAQERRKATLSLTISSTPASIFIHNVNISDFQRSEDEKKESKQLQSQAISYLLLKNVETGLLKPFKFFVAV